jgi:uncharacterized membrane protein
VTRPGPATLAAVEPELATAVAADHVGVAPPVCAHWAPADLRMRRILLLPVDATKATEESARSLVERSLLISMVRCLLTYIVLPFVAPILGIGLGVTPMIGILVGAVAIVANLASVRRFWRADHRYRWHYTALASVIVVMLTWLIVADVVGLLS